MFKETNNPYRFKYLITGIKGDGIEQVYLPKQPTKKDILFKKEQKFVRFEIPPEARQWKKIQDQEQENNPNYYHPELTKLINKWWHYRENGLWFWNNGQATYITGLHFVHLHTKHHFGYGDFRDTEKEVFYWVQFWEEDPDAYGGTLNTMRRWGKSCEKGTWMIEKVSRTAGMGGGMQGESKKKIDEYYKKFVLRPFVKWPWFWQPITNEATKQGEKIEFFETRSTGKLDFYDEEIEVLESQIDHRPSGESQYDGDKLCAYDGEEPGKWLEASVDDTWGTVKKCFWAKDKWTIIGKAFFATTVEFMEMDGRGGSEYKTLVYESDYNDKQKDGRTKSGLYAALLPSDCAADHDEHGFPLRDIARQKILDSRQSYSDNPVKLAKEIRKSPLTWRECFYHSSVDSPFNLTILRDRSEELLSLDAEQKPTRGDYEWENNVRDSRVIWQTKPNTGWSQVPWLPKTKEETNLVRQIGVTEIAPGIHVKQFEPLNDAKFIIGLDPTNTGMTTTGKRSKPVALVKRKYDHTIDGKMDNDLMEQRSKNKFPYKTNKYVGMCDHRPLEPTMLYEYLIKMCVFYGCQIHIEDQVGKACKDYFYMRGYRRFIMEKYRNLIEKPDPKAHEFLGTPASRSVISDYTSYLSTYIQYFGHTIPFLEVTEDMEAFKPQKPRDHDYTVSAGYVELGCLLKPKPVKQTIIFGDYFHQFDSSGKEYESVY